MAQNAGYDEILQAPVTLKFPACHLL